MKRQLMNRLWFPTMVILVVAIASIVAMTNIKVDNQPSYEKDFMIIQGLVVSDGTVETIEGWVVTVYAYQPPPTQISHAPPIGSKCAQATCDSAGNYRISLKVPDLLARNVTKIVVLASPNPRYGQGWIIMDVTEGRFNINLTASKVPALP